MKKFLICFICIFSITAHADNETFFITDPTDNKIVPVYLNYDDIEPTDFKCYKDIDLSELKPKLSGGNYNEVLLYNSAYAELASENNNQIKIKGMLCGHDEDCPAGTYYIGEASIGSSATREQAVFWCTYDHLPNRKNYEWVKMRYTRECLVPDGSTPETVIDDKLFKRALNVSAVSVLNGIPPKDRVPIIPCFNEIFSLFYFSPSDLFYLLSD